jgi:pyridinium-3,5-biscarboxylic acid mononucleotide sulfurtransferase
MDWIMTTTSAAPAASLDTKYARLREILIDCASVCVGYSGGVDSVLLAVTAVQTLGAGRVLAVTGLSPAYPEVQREVARRCAREFGVPHIEIDTHEIDDERYAANPSNRCYYCKSELWPKLIGVAHERGFATVLDGSNADDAHDYRPGFAAAVENAVRSPLLEAGLTKDDVRTLSRRLALPTWDQPSAPCLASRLPYGVAVTPDRLRQVERAEAELRTLGFRELRVRHHDDCLRIELAPAELPRAIARAAEIHERLIATGVTRVLLDAEGYRRGALNEGLVQIAAVARAPQEPASSPVPPPHSAAGQHHDIAVVHVTSLAEAQRAADAIRALGFRFLALDLALPAEA